MISKNGDGKWHEGYLNNVWCRFKVLLSPTGDLFVIAKKDSTVRVFRLKKELVDKYPHEEMNDVMKFAQEIPLLKIPKFVRKGISR
jgi:hypothetical protein